MNSNWRNRPTTAEYISNDIDYIVAIDESGNPNLNQVLKAMRKGCDVAEAEKHFVIAACLIDMEDFGQSRDMVMTLKRQYWDDALFKYKEGAKRVCFHSREIRGHKEAFSPEVINYDAFIADLSRLMKEMPFTLFSVHIDKWAHVNQYRYPELPYDLSITFLLERVMRNIPESANCVLILESRGKKEDGELLQKIVSLLDHGSNYHSADSFKKIKGVYFNPKWCKISDQSMSFWELELADLCAYPIYKHYAHGSDDKSYQAILHKIYGYPNCAGKGLKSFP